MNPPAESNACPVTGEARKCHPSRQSPQSAAPMLRFTVPSTPEVLLISDPSGSTTSPVAAEPLTRSPETVSRPAGATVNFAPAWMVRFWNCACMFNLTPAGLATRSVEFAPAISEPYPPIAWAEVPLNLTVPGEEGEKKSVPRCPT